MRGEDLYSRDRSQVGFTRAGSHAHRIYRSFSDRPLTDCLNHHVEVIVPPHTDYKPCRRCFPGRGDGDE